MQMCTYTLFNFCFFDAMRTDLKSVQSENFALCQDSSADRRQESEVGNVAIAQRSKGEGRKEGRKIAGGEKVGQR